MGQARRKKDTAQVLPSGMTAGAQARLDRLVNEFGYKALGFVDTKYGKVYMAEKKEQFRGSLYSPYWRVIWGARDAAQELEFAIDTSPKGRAQAAVNAAHGYLLDRNDVYKEV